jgi:RES domain-containing protein
MILYRCALTKWAKDLTGQGAFNFGGRWNSPGRYAIYTAENNLLAVMEVAIRVPLNNISADYIMIPISVPDQQEVYVPKLAKNWNRNQKSTRAIGDLFLEENKYLLMKVPSALMNNAYNFLINPNHKFFKEVKVQKSQSLLFDERLIKMLRSENE